MRRLFTARRGRRGIEDEEEEEDFSTRDHEEEEGGEGIRRRNGKREEGFEGSLKNSFSDDEEEDEDVSALWRLPRDKGGGRREEEGDYSHVPCSSCSYEIVQSVSFNQDGSCLSLATNRGFLIYSTEPLLQTFSRDLTREFDEARADQEEEDGGESSMRGLPSNSSSSRGVEEEERRGVRRTRKGAHRRRGLLVVEMLYTCNILALVGNGPSSSSRFLSAGRGRRRGGGRRQGEEEETWSVKKSRWCEDVCVIWDDRQEKAVVQLQFYSPIRSIQMLKEVLVVILREKICLYRLRDLLLIDTIPTSPNLRAICAIASLHKSSSSSSSSAFSSSSCEGQASLSSSSSSLGGTVLVACPALQIGCVQLLVYGDRRGEKGRGGEDERERERVSTSTLASLHANQGRERGGAIGEGGEEGPQVPPGSPHLLSSLSIFVHSNRLACLCLSQDGSLLATASTRGTLLRLFNTQTGDFLMEFRRGSHPACISCLSFSRCLRFLASCSNTGTIHLYTLQKKKDSSSSFLSSSSCSSLSSSLPQKEKKVFSSSSSSSPSSSPYLTREVLDKMAHVSSSSSLSRLEKEERRPPLHQGNLSSSSSSSSSSTAFSQAYPREREERERLDLSTGRGYSKNNISSSSSSSSSFYGLQATFLSSPSVGYPRGGEEEEKDMQHSPRDKMQIHSKRGMNAPDKQRSGGRVTAGMGRFKAGLQFLGKLSPFFQPQWSFAQFRLPSVSKDCEGAICAFGHQANTLLVVSSRGVFYKLLFDPVEGGEMRALSCETLSSSSAWSSSLSK